MKCRKDLLGVTALRDKQSLRYVRSRKVELKFAKTKLSKGGKRTVRFLRYLFALRSEKSSPKRLSGRVVKAADLKSIM